MSASTVQPAFVPELEQQVLGAILVGGDFRVIQSFLRADHFISDFHKVLFKAIVSSFEQYGSSTLPIVVRLLSDEDKKLCKERTKESASEYLAFLAANTTKTTAGLRSAARAVIQQWARVTVFEQSLRLNAVVSDPAVDVSGVLKDFARDMDSVSSELRVGAKRKTRGTLFEATEVAFTEVEEAMQRGNGLTGVTYGLTDVNRATGGLQRGELTILGARPSMGKTAVAVSIGIRGARSGAGTGVISLEMVASKLAMRAATDIAYDWNTKVPYSDLITGRVSREDFDAIKAATQDLDDLPLWIEEQPGLSMADIRVKLEWMLEQGEKAGKPLQSLIVDYMQLIKPADRYQGNKVGEVTEISMGLKNIAREYNIAVMALSQLSRKVEEREDKRPMLSDLRDSGSIEQDADTVIFLFREAYYLEKTKGKNAEAESARIERLADIQNKLEFIIAKQRNGQVKTIDLFIEPACSAVRNAARY